MDLRFKQCLAVSMVIFALSGCATTSTYSTFAKAGSTYATAVDKLLVVAGEAQVDASSWEIITNKEDSGRIKTTNYKAFNEEDEKKLQTLEGLRKHAKLLARYFDSLNTLATSDAPKQTETQIKGIVNDMKVIDSKLPAITAALSPLAGFIADMTIRKALRDELITRKDTIRKELYLQEKLIEKLKREITDKMKEIEEMKKTKLVDDPILGNRKLNNYENWITARRNMMCKSSKVEELDTASQAAKKMRQTFEDIYSDNITEEKLNSLISDMQTLLSIANTLKQ